VPGGRAQSATASLPACSRRDVLAASAFAAAAGGLPLLGGCGRRDEPGARDSMTFLTVLPLTSLTFTPELLADAGGYFADQRLDVAFQTTRGTAQAIQLVLAGSAPLTRVGQIEAISHAANRGAPVMNVATVIKESTIRFVSSVKAPLEGPEDFDGKTVGVPSEGGEAATTLDLILASWGIDPARVRRQVVGVSPGVFSLVEQGRLAGFAVSLDTANILEQQRPDVVVMRAADFIESGAQIYMAAADRLAEERELIRRYLAAVAGAIEFVIGDDGFGRTLEILRGKYSFPALDDDRIARDSLNEYVRAWTAAGSGNVMRTVPDRWQLGYEELVSAGLAEAGRNPAEWFTNDLLPG
jgi:ABC-type nitrate/sulfonate/bicarbonate transport system substrate-binding protein